jgi:hypothetical protein
LEWTFSPNSFDFTHIRALKGGIADWPKLYGEVFKCTKPGGYVEHLEIDIMLTSDDGTVDENHFMHKWSTILSEAGEKLGKSLNLNEKMRDGMEAAGFEDVQERIFKVPIGSWPSDPKMKLLGRWAQLFCLEGVDSWALYLLSQVMKVGSNRIQKNAH